MSPAQAPPTARVDVWLWSVRLFRTRSLATAACKAGHVRINGERAKPAAPVGPGDRVVVRGGERERDVEVVQVLLKRVGASAAAAAVVDHSPAPLPREVFAVPRRERGAGRPTKRERRDITRLRGH
ncbi:RNA-binding S4 domain-containing protein [Georgenia muralis]|uniref:Heat shock protein Hsp15 n=1 Tax=Georgenia muralis TaxID=154117 RepID=A0A3N4Z221_9MICO|nr:RNA-binding S4 domain-containing protein [Georgenia muralis]RPF25864.1 heat shock protein Hsp15 [Georgenia muralis]